ncbi:hypothetical protein [Salinibacter ruber]|uniref:hypothetical protein n=1 Tax=Salinibacter ruber TaxID=146919 RepID=UPI001F081727|nr:hypothetical protein [Salinibacter ruber]
MLGLVGLLAGRGRKGRLVQVGVAELSLPSADLVLQLAAIDVQLVVVDVPFAGETREGAAGQNRAEAGRVQVLVPEPTRPVVLRLRPL